MYASEMQMCCYNNVKYFIGIKFHVYHQRSVLIERAQLFQECSNRMSQIATFVMQRLLHQHVEHVQCFVHSVVHSTSIGMSKSDQLKVLVVLFFPPTLWVFDGKVLLPFNTLLRFIVGSFNWLYSLGLRTLLFLWLNHLMNKLLWCF